LTNIKNNAEKQILNTLKKQYALNKILREETGTDIDTQRLGNTIRLV
jgi:fructose-1,6-bisphosphatase/inositol monophosphatase family enzyme